MKQPVSRNSFDQRRGYLGVHLQEGAPFVDATWNEAVDVQSALLRDVIIDAGLEGSAGLELHVEPQTDGDEIVNLLVHGGPGRFYCAGLPVLYPEDQLVFPGDPYCMTLEQSDMIKLWLQQPEFGVYLNVWVETEDALDRPDLDDPGVGVERGSYRKVVRSCITVGEPERSAPTPTNLLLTVQGSYIADVNALYRVEPRHLKHTKRGDFVSILWDSANAATVALVTNTAEQAATSVELSTTEGFQIGHYVRFEGPGVGDEIYRITNCDSTTITIEGHACDEPPVSLEKYHALSREEGEGGRFTLEILDDFSKVSVSGVLQVGSRVNQLPADLQPTGPTGIWQVTSVTSSQSLADVDMDIQHGPHQQLILTLAKHSAERIGVGSIVRDLPQPYYQGPWQVLDITTKGTKYVLTATPCGSVSTRVEFAPNGLLKKLNPWDDERAAQLQITAHSFDVCLEVQKRTDWREGMRIRISADPDVLAESASDAVEDLCSCTPGRDRVNSFEDRTIAKIIRHVSGDSMTVRLDQPLSYDHQVGARVVPMRLIKARRYCSHLCQVAIDRLDPAVQPDTTEHYGPYSLEGGVALENGLMIRISVECAKGYKDTEMRGKDREETQPCVIAGDAWTFAARCGGWVESRIFAPVERVPRGFVQLACRTAHSGARLIDTRPVPAAHAQRPWLDMIRASLNDIACYAKDRARFNDTVTRLAGPVRAQQGLLRALAGARSQLSEPVETDERCQTALERFEAVLRESSPELGPAEGLSATQLSCIAVALERVAFALSFLAPLSSGDPGGGDSNNPDNASDPPPEQSEQTSALEASGAADSKSTSRLAVSEGGKAYTTRKGERQFYPLNLPTRSIRPWRTLRQRLQRFAFWGDTLRGESKDSPISRDPLQEDSSTTRSDAVWRSRMPTDQLRRVFSIQDAIAYYERRSTKEGR